MARISGDVAQRLRRSAEQDGIDNALVLERDLRDLRRQGEDHVVVGHRQQLSLARLQPLRARQALALRTVPVAAGNVQCTLAALWANSVMGSQRRLSPVRCCSWPVLLSITALSRSKAISLSGGRKEPLRKWGGTIASMASSFSVGSPRV